MAWGSDSWGEAPWGAGAGDAPSVPTFPDAQIESVTVLGSTLIRVDFNVPMKVDGFLTDPSNYTVSPLTEQLPTPTPVEPVAANGTAQFFEDTANPPSCAIISDVDQTGLDGGVGLTIEAWVYITSYGTFGEVIVVDKWEAPGLVSYRLSVQTSGDQISVLWSVASGARRTLFFDTGGMALNEWHHIACTRETSSGETRGFLNGVQVDSTSTLLAGFDLDTSAMPFRIGAGNSFNIDYEGYISDVRVWSVARTPAELLENYQSRLEGSETNLEGYWPLTEDFDDLTANANHLTATAGASASAPEIVEFESPISLPAVEEPEVVTLEGGAPVSVKRVITPSGAQTSYVLLDITRFTVGSDYVVDIADMWTTKGNTVDTGNSSAQFYGRITKLDLAQSLQPKMYSTAPDSVFTAVLIAITGEDEKIGGTEGD